MSLDVKPSSVRALAAGLALTLLATVAHTQIVEDDWKVFGFTDPPKAEMMFLLQSDLTHPSANSVRVWTKVLSSPKLTNASQSLTKHDPAFEQIVRKLAAKYTPPLAKVRKVSDDEALDLIGFEAIADVGTIKPKMRVLYEINCAEETFRVITVVADNASPGAPPSAWRPVPPESNMRYMQLLTCP
jgi:hypothetical protein